MSLPGRTLHLDRLMTVLGFLHLRTRYTVADPVRSDRHPSRHLFPGNLAEEGEPVYTGLGGELGVCGSC